MKEYKIGGGGRERDSLVLEPQMLDGKKCMQIEGLDIFGWGRIVLYLITPSITRTLYSCLVMRIYSQNYEQTVILTRMFLHKNLRVNAL